MKIVFEIVRWKNFLSTGSQFTEVVLDKDSTTLIIGENGSGKSTILDAICFALFNKPFRNINKPQLINTINQKQMVVELIFTIGTKKYRIVRGQKPTVFEIYCNDKLVNQDAASRDYQKYLEENILKHTYKSFTQIVVLGSASFTPFMQLNTSSRREVIEDLLDIKIFSAMNEALKARVAGNKEKLQQLTFDIDVLKNKVQVQQNYVDTLIQDEQKRTKDTDNTILEKQNENESLQQEIEAINKEIKNLSLQVSDESESKTKVKDLETAIVSLEQNIKKHKKEIAFYTNNTACPTCNQDITEEHKCSSVKHHQDQVAELIDALTTTNQTVIKTNKRLEEIQVINKEISEKQRRINQLQVRYSSNLQFINELIKTKKLDENKNDNIQQAKAKVKELARAIVELGSKKKDALEEKQYLDIASTLLKDSGIKTKIIEQYLPVINKLVNKYLQAMEFFCYFELDESFNETIKSRHRDDFSYQSFSEGEKARIDIAILLTFRELARMKNTINTNLLLMDEIFDSSLDTAGTDYVMTTLNTIGKDTNCFVISHRDALHDKFNRTIKFEKHNNFSIIAR